MPFVMMTIGEMGTVPTEEAVMYLLTEEAMIAGGLVVHTVEIGVVLIMAVDLIQVPDLNREEEELLIMTEVQVRLMIDTTEVQVQLMIDTTGTR